MTNQMKQHKMKTIVETGQAAGLQFLSRGGDANAPQLILLHGVGSDANSFEGLMAALPPSLSLLAWNAPGYAASRPLAKAFPTPCDYAQALKMLLDARGLSRVVLVGHSLGALFAASFAASHPDQVISLALISPALGYRVPAGAPLPPNVQMRIDELDSLGPVAFAQKRAAGLVGDPEQKPQVVVAVQRSMAAVHPAGYTQAVRALGAGDMLADIPRISVPALVMVGSKDAITPPDKVRTAHAAFKVAATYREINGAGHALPQEEPAAAAALLLRLAKDIHD